MARPRVSEEQKKARKKAYGKEYYINNKEKWRDGVKEAVCGLYILSNTVNDKVYVGVSRDVYQRIAQHKKKTYGSLCDIAPCDTWSATVLFQLPKLDIFILNRFESFMIAHYGERAINQNNRYPCDWERLQSIIESNKEHFCSETICKLNEIAGFPGQKLDEENGLK